ncbi:hypothetical protein PM10SUCC1_16970 [Propionigenium maris DSM 9537]|uniref:non-specific serine/threonine protein kinase n=1 Tax=Propionigenium maris DSM 9537 TaxID=1123000 RepID=A0A9W6GJ94_9FUSO|nr:RIO1 family regulatory kinase/ATPase [Propionigenium maris]GLI56183.1 hypothetical protein PM10SUCC1_16970 [Propionigenium maris DSM 9537]
MKMTTITDIEDKFPAKVSRITSEGEIYYLKRNIEKKITTKRAMNILQKFLADILKIKTLAPTANTEQHSTHEADKISSLREAGLKVPEIHYSCEEYFIMEDCGHRLKDILKREEADKTLYLREAVKSLALLHNHGFAHGGSQIRNFTVKDGEVYMIDFEEKIHKKYLSAIQFRDVLVFLISIASLRARDIDYYEILKVYEEHSSSKDSILNRIIKLTDRLYFLGRLSRTRVSKFFGKDLLFISYLIDDLSSIKRA